MIKNDSMKKNIYSYPAPPLFQSIAPWEWLFPCNIFDLTQFSKIFGVAAKGAKYLFQTKQDGLLLAATGITGDMF